MLLEEIKNIKSEKKDLRNFGLLFGVVFGILGGLLWWREKETYTLFLVASAFFFFSGLLMPILLKPLQKAWMTLAVVLGFFMTNIILSVLFYFVFTGIGLGSRILGRKFLDLKFDSSRNSYWIQRKSASFDKRNYERQF